MSLSNNLILTTMSNAWKLDQNLSGLDFGQGDNSLYIRGILSLLSALAIKFQRSLLLWTNYHLRHCRYELGYM